MALILSIETATEICSVALTHGTDLIASRQSAGSNEHSALLTLFIGEILNNSGLSLKEIDGVAVSMGPGSYTGLRIGVSTAKGLCYSLDKPLIAVSTLKAMARQALIQNQELLHPGDLLCPMIDARRMEVFTALFNEKLEEVTPVSAMILSDDTFDQFERNRIFIFGNGSSKCRELFAGKAHIYFPDPVWPSAYSVSLLALTKFRAGTFENTAYFEPYYLKDFIAGIPKVKGLYQ